MIHVRASAPQPAATGYVRHTATILPAGKVDDVWFMTPAGAHPVSDDWLLPVGAVIGMALGEDVHVDGRVSERLLASLEEIQRIAVQRHDGLTHVRITAEEVAPTPRAERARVLACFSGGVDAFYTLLDPSHHIDDLLYVHGFEARKDDERLLALVLPRIRAAAAEAGKSLRLAETNWRSVIEPLTGHAYFVSAPMLFAITYLMESDVARLVVPGTQDPFFEVKDPSSVSAYVSHWQTEGLDISEHGHVSRLEKVRRLTESDVAMRHLRVCWARDGWIYNCGRCGKCLRTRVHLKLAGAEGRCETLPPHVGLDEVRRARSERAENLRYIDENIAESEAQGLTDLAEALRVQRLQRSEAPTWWHAPRAKLERTLRRIRREYHKWRIDGALRRRKRRCPGDHLFNCLEDDPPRREG